MATLFPLFLKLHRRKCLVVGAGQIGEGKIAGLLRAGANVYVVAPVVTERVETWARGRQVRWSQRKFRDSDLTGCFLVIAATSSSELHERIFRLARQRGILCNVVDVPELCDFYYPAVVRRGALQIAVSTAGESPALAQRLRKKLEREFGPEYAAWLRELGRSRRKFTVISEDTLEKKTKLHSMASEESFRAFLHKRAAKEAKAK
jgi:precorrin-2 dehydrogenase/sirohydrochlorin ferrochelatase